MLSSDEIAELSGAVCATAEALGQTISANAARLIAGDLAEYEPHAIQSALRACRRELTGKLTLAAILQRVFAADSRPGKDEAWSIALTASDESETVVMTAEIRQAMRVARPILSLGDKVGARMAFLSAYERLVTLARTEALPVQWSVSLGFDSSRRAAAIESAVSLRLITPESGTRYLADLRLVPITDDGQAIAGLLTGSSAAPSSRIRQNLAEVRSILDAARDCAKLRKINKAQAQRVDSYLRKRKVRKAIAAHCKEQH